MAFVALDCETTRRFRDPAAHRIVEFYAARMQEPLSLVWEAELGFVVDPGVPIPPDASVVHGFTDRDVANLPTFAHYAAEVQAFIDGAVLCAFNGRRHDFPLLDSELKRCGQPGLAPGQLVVDPYEILKEQWPQTLDGALRIHGLDANKRPHSAEHDTRALVRLLGAQLPLGRLQGRSMDVADWATPWQAPRHFQRSDAGWMFAFGKHHGEPASAHPAYLRWMLGADFPDASKDVARQVLAEASA